MCPDNAVIKLGPGKRFEFNYDYCKGCGICARSARAARSRWSRKKSEMSAYVIGDIEVTDAAVYEDYRRQVAATVQKYGGRFVVRGGKVEALEGGWSPKRVVLLEFPSMEQAQKWYRSSEYAPLIALRQRASRGKLVLVEGA